MVDCFGAILQHGLGAWKRRQSALVALGVGLVMQIIKAQPEDRHKDHFLNGNMYARICVIGTCTNEKIYFTIRNRNFSVGRYHPSFEQEAWRI